LPSIASQLEGLTRVEEKYGIMVDETIFRLNSIEKDASAALEFPKKSYNRRLGTQDTLDRINALRGFLQTNFLEESKEIVQPLDRLATSIYQSLFQAEEKTTGFRNPYLTGNPIALSRSALFKGRMELTEKIIGILRSSSAVTFVLFGPRRMGKTSFLLQLPRLLPAHYLPVYIDVQMGIAQSDAEFLYGMANAIFGQTTKTLNLKKPDFANFKADPYYAINEWLDDLYPKIGDRVLFFTIDEFEKIGEAISSEKLTVHVLEYMRHLMQHNSNITLLFAGVQTIDALGPNPASYFISAYPIEISYLAYDEAVELIKNPDPSAGAMPAYDKQVLNEMIRITRCQPFLIQALCNEIIGIANKKNLTVIKQEVLKEAVEKVLTTSLYFSNIWEDAGHEGQILLKNLIVNPDIRLDPVQTPKVNELLRRHVICKNEGQTFSIEIPLVELWLRGQ
jgi:hypothetical protein